MERLAVLLGTPLAIAADVLDRAGGLDALLRLEADALAGVPGIGARRAARLAAALWVGRRASHPRADPRGRVTDARTAWSHLAPGLSGLADEELHALYVDRRHRPLALRRLTVGSDRFTVVDPRQIFRPAVSLAATGVILAHNHPSGDETPSPQDREVTRRVCAAGRVLGIPLLDHLVIGQPGWTSMREVGDIDGTELVGASWTS